ncbi:MAG: Ig-like domain-containing protein, partial [Tannerellaceae bacterium]|nr:Ig-like domain-containing protein [Tannerellaceae bacterium]
TDFSVNMESIILPVGESARIKVKFTPSDAADVKLVWSSNNESVATVNDGIVTIVGVGTAIITVSSGNISKTVAVTGAIRSLTLTAPEGIELLPGTTFPLTAIPDPADAQISLVWTSDNEAVATVTSAGEVTIEGNGTANITATAGPVSATYAVICEDLFDSASGYWEFDDPSNLVRAVRGEQLVQRGDGIKLVEGPSATNLAVEVPMHEYFEAYLKMQPNGGIDDATPTRVNQWTIMLDLRLPTVRSYY